MTRPVDPTGAVRQRDALGHRLLELIVDEWPHVVADLEGRPIVGGAKEWAARWGLDCPWIVGHAGAVITACHTTRRSATDEWSRLLEEASGLPLVPVELRLGWDPQAEGRAGAPVLQARKRTEATPEGVRLEGTEAAWRLQVGGPREHARKELHAAVDQYLEWIAENSATPERRSFGDDRRLRWLLHRNIDRWSWEQVARRDGAMGVDGIRKAAGRLAEELEFPLR